MVKCHQSDLSAFFDGQLPEHRRVLMAEHISQCRSCARTLAVYESISSHLRSLPRAQVPGSLRAALYGRLDEIDRRRAAHSIVATWLRGFALISATTLVALVVSLLLRTYNLSGPLFLQTAEVTVAVGSSSPSRDLLLAQETLSPTSETLSPTSASLIPAVERQATSMQGSESPVEDAASSQMSTAKDGPAQHADDGPADFKGHPDQPRSAPTAQAATRSEQALQPADVMPASQGAVLTLPDEERVTAAEADGEVIQAGRKTAPQGKVAARDNADMPASDRPGRPAVSGPRAELGTTAARAPTGAASPAIGKAAVDAEARREEFGSREANLVTMASRAGDCVEQPRPEASHSVSNKNIRQRLGCALGPAQAITLTERVLDWGYTFSRGREGTYVLADSPSLWTYYPTTAKHPMIDASREAELDAGPNPTGNTGASIESITTDSAEASIRDYLGEVVDFQHGTTIWSERRVIYVLYSNGTWQDFPEQAGSSVAAQAVDR